MVNFSFFLLATYLLILPLVPCGDKQECNEASSKTQLSTSEHQEHEEENESCTPFCYCACCSTITTDLRITLEPELVTWVSTFEFTHSSALQPLRSYGVWQPPRLV
jgi:hypothetical protein